jgi:hypothetical protein
MPTMVPVKITQTQEEIDNPTMAIPHWNAFFVPQILEIKEIPEIAEIAEITGIAGIAEIPERRLTQKTLKFFDNKFERQSGPTHACVPVDEHVRGDGTIVPSYMRKQVKPKKQPKTRNSNKRTGKAKAQKGAFPRMPVGYKHKGDYDAAFSSHLEDRLALTRGNKK